MIIKLLSFLHLLYIFNHKKEGNIRKFLIGKYQFKNKIKNHDLYYLGYQYNFQIFFRFLKKIFFLNLNKTK
jgi:hypothetical protein